MLSEQQGRYLAYAAFALAIIGLFVWGIPLGLIAMAISAFGVYKSETKGLNWNALALSAITVIIGII